MDNFLILLFIGFILAGVVIAYPIGYAIGRKSVFKEFDFNYDNAADVLEAEYLEVKR